MIGYALAGLGARLVMYSFKDKKIHIFCIAFLFSLEAALSMWTGLPYDMKIWFQTGLWMNQGINVYVPSDHLGYPPLWAIWCLVAYRFYLFFGNNIEVWRLVLKLPLIIASFAFAYAVGIFAAKEFGRGTATRIFLIVLTWSFFIYIGALWGQINTLSTLLTFLAFEAMSDQRVSKSAFLLGTAITLKIYPLVVLPAFLAYAWKKIGNKEAAKFLLWTAFVPLVFTSLIFTVLQWDILYFLKTIFYWTPVFESNAIQIQGGCMNLWSFLSLFRIDVSTLWYLRLVWIPVLLGGTIYWLKKPSWRKSDLNLSIITLYLLFMISYAWVPEQTFVDPLPFLFLQIIGYRPRKSQFFALAAIQILVYAFSAVNYGEGIFEPLLKRFSPSTIAQLQVLHPTTGSLAWATRGTIGLIISIFLGILLVILLKTPSNNSQPNSLS